MIDARSRYRDSQIDKVEDENGDSRLVILPRLPSDWQFDFNYYRVFEGDEPDLLAHHFYGDSSLWWMIADANPEIRDWTTLTPGTIIRIPHA